MGKKTATMCGRFSLSTPAKSLADFFEIEILPKILPRFNIAPSQDLSAIRFDEQEKNRVYSPFKWGLIPSWAKDPKIGYRMINARAETVAEKPAYRSAFKKRRCLIMADGFYEWQKLTDKKQPYYFHLKEHSPFAFAGLWESWQHTKSKAIQSCTLITTEANSTLKKVHHRMPVILDPKDYDQWLDPNEKDPKKLEKLLKPYPPKKMTGYPVSTRVNNPQNDSKECIKPKDS